LNEAGASNSGFSPLTVEPERGTGASGRIDGDQLRAHAGIRWHLCVDLGGADLIDEGVLAANGHRGPVQRRRCGVAGKVGHVPGAESTARLVPQISIHDPGATPKVLALTMPQEEIAEADVSG
jgi:hypothetical protein